MENTQNTNLDLDAPATRKRAWNGWKSAVVILSITSCSGIGLFAASLLWKHDSETTLNSTIANLETSLVTLENRQPDNCPAETPEEKPVDEVPEEPVLPEISNRRYLTINEWGVKIEIPQGLQQMTYRYDSGMSDGRDSSVSLSGKLMKDFARGDSFDYPFALKETEVSISRAKTPTYQDQFMGTEKSDFKVGDYYYYIRRWQQEAFLEDIRSEIVRQQTTVLVQSAAFTLDLS